MTLHNKNTNNKEKINLWLICDACLLVATLLIYGCSSEQKKAANWEEINYAKVTCGNNAARGKDCGSSDIDVMAMTRGGKR